MGNDYVSFQEESVADRTDIIALKPAQKLFCSIFYLATRLNR